VRSTNAGILIKGEGKVSREAEGEAEGQLGGEAPDVPQSPAEPGASTPDKGGVRIP
jgi:hypothetical protein